MTSVTIALLEPLSPRPALPTTTAREYVDTSKSGNRIARLLAVLQGEPQRQWRARESAELLGDVTVATTCRQTRPLHIRRPNQEGSHGPLRGIRTVGGRFLTPPAQALTTGPWGNFTGTLHPTTAHMRRSYRRARYRPPLNAADRHMPETYPPSAIERMHAISMQCSIFKA